MTSMRRTNFGFSTASLLTMMSMDAFAQAPATTVAPAEVRAPRQAQSDDYTRYELLDPSSASFRIVYEVTATTVGARYFWNPIRKGSIASNESVTNPATGLPLKFAEVSGAEAKTNGLGNADPETRYIQIELPRPVPKDGESRLIIDKTYKDEKSYYTDPKTGFIVFDRSLGIKRNSLVLPAGYEVVSCSYPSQVAAETTPAVDGKPAVSRLRLSFMNIGPDAASYVVKARKLANPLLLGELKIPEAPRVPTNISGQNSERAHQDREIVYFLKPPDTNAFELFHDVTIADVGRSTYINVVRAGSKASNPSAFNLDTGEALKVQTFRGDEITKNKIDVGSDPVTPETEAVVITYPVVEKGKTTRIRIWETYTDPERYKISGDIMVWDRSFGRPQNAVNLPEGFFLVGSAFPARISLTDDNRIRLDYMNPRNDEVRALIYAKKR